LRVVVLVAEIRAQILRPVVVVEQVVIAHLPEHRVVAPLPNQNFKLLLEPLTP
jgi:hypothetical protein